MKFRKVGQCAAGALLIHSECCVSITGDRVGGGWGVIDRVRDVETLNASFGAVWWVLFVAQVARGLEQEQEAPTAIPPW